MSEPTGSEFAQSRIERAWEDPEEVVLPRPIIKSTLQPEDIGVLAWLLLRRPGLPGAMTTLASEMQADGWKMGESRLRSVMGRLKAAGHINHYRDGIDPETGTPRWVFKLYRNPANNVAYVDQGTEEASQVRAIGWKSTERSMSDRVDSNGSAGGTDRVDSNGQRSGGNPRNAQGGRVFAGQQRSGGNSRNAGSPPHPPEEVDTSSPYPLNGTSLARGEEEAGSLRFTDEQLAEAAVWLGRLPQPWTAGRKVAKELAPELLEAVADQGWELDDRLAAELTKNPGGIHSHVRVLRKDRIPNLVRREMVHGRTAAVASGGRPEAPHCGDVDCDRITRTRDEEINGRISSVPCKKCADLASV